MADSRDEHFDLADENRDRDSADSVADGASEVDAGSTSANEEFEDGLLDASAEPNGATTEVDVPEAPAEVAATHPEDEETEEERRARETEEELLLLFQATVHTEQGTKIGRVGQVYLDDQTQEPNWITVKTGLFGMKEFFIPLDDSRREEKKVIVPYDKATVLAAPRTEVDQNLSPSEEDALYNHYQVDGKTTADASLDGVEPVSTDSQPIDIDGLTSSDSPTDATSTDDPSTSSGIGAPPDDPSTSSGIGAPPAEPVEASNDAAFAPPAGDQSADADQDAFDDAFIPEPATPASSRDELRFDAFADDEDPTVESPESAKEDER